MNIDLTKLLTNQSDELVLQEPIEFDQTKFQNTTIRKLKDTTFHGSITRLCDGSYQIEGTIEGIMILPDDVTLENVEYPFKSEIEEKFSEVEGNEDHNLKIIQNRLDIRDFLWQNIVVEIPLKVKDPKNENITLKGNGWRLVTEEELKESNNSPLSELSKIFDSRKE